MLDKGSQHIAPSSGRLQPKIPGLQGCYAMLQHTTAFVLIGQAPCCNTPQPSEMSQAHATFQQDYYVA